MSCGEEKNWNLILGEKLRLFMEYFIEPHIVLGRPGLVRWRSGWLAADVDAEHGQVVQRFL